MNIASPFSTEMNRMSRFSLLRRGRVLTFESAVAVIILLGMSLSASASSHGRKQNTDSISVAGLYQLLGSSSSMGSEPNETTTSALGFQAGREKSAGSSCTTNHGWLRTQGAWIVEDADPRCKVRLEGVTWFGMESTSYTLAGLNFKPYTAILREIADLGFNSIRIPLTDELVKNNSRIKIAPKWMRAQDRHDVPRHIHPLQFLDKVVAAAGALHLMIILDNHFSKARPASKVANHIARRGSGAHKDSETTWAADGYTEKQWITDWVSLTKRYRNNPTVIGYDLRNEPHTDHTGNTWTLKDYVTRGATWGPCTPTLCGKLARLWKPSSNWVSAAEAAGNAVQRVNPHLLLFVEGVQLYPEPKAKYGAEAYWWGSILKGVKVDPVKFRVPNHLVYSPHEWGPWKCCVLAHEFGKKTTYASVTKVFRQNWAYILTDNKVQAPIWLGEFNTCNSAQPHTRWTFPIKTAGGCVNSKKPGSQGQWFHILITFLKNNPEIGWCYYPLNGTNVLDEESSNSVLDKSWSKPRLPALMSALRTIEGQPD
jgi:endoglucanase